MVLCPVIMYRAIRVYIRSILGRILTPDISTFGAKRKWVIHKITWKKFTANFLLAQKRLRTPNTGVLIWNARSVFATAVILYTNHANEPHPICLPNTRERKILLLAVQDIVSRINVTAIQLLGKDLPFPVHFSPKILILSKEFFMTALAYGSKTTAWVKTVWTRRFPDEVSTFAKYLNIWINLKHFRGLPWTPLLSRKLLSWKLVLLEARYWVKRWKKRAWLINK